MKDDILKTNQFINVCSMEEFTCKLGASPGGNLVLMCAVVRNAASTVL